MAGNKLTDRRNEDMEAKKEFQENVISIDRVARVVKGGRRFRFRALVVVGDGKNRVGVGIAKGSDVQASVAKAVEAAKKNFITVPIYRDTLPHDATGVSGGAKVLLKPASSGTGVIAGGTVRAVLDVLNIHNVLSKSLGSSNKVNVAYATIEALKSLKSAKDWVTTKHAAKSSEKKPAKKAEVKV